MTDQADEYRGWLAAAVSKHRDQIRHNKAGLARAKIASELESKGLTYVEVHIDKSPKNPWADEAAAPNIAYVQCRAGTTHYVSIRFNTGGAGDDKPDPAPKGGGARQKPAPAAAAASPAAEQRGKGKGCAADPQQQQQQRERALKDRVAQLTAAAERRASDLAAANARIEQLQLAAAARRPAHADDSSGGSDISSADSEGAGSGGSECEACRRHGAAAAAAERLLKERSAEHAAAMVAATAEVASLKQALAAAGEQQEKAAADANKANKRMARQDRALAAANAAAAQSAAAAAAAEHAAAAAAAEHTAAELTRTELAASDVLFPEREREARDAAAQQERVVVALTDEVARLRAALAERDCAVAGLRCDVGKLSTTLMEVTIQLGEKGAALRTAQRELAALAPEVSANAALAAKVAAWAPSCGDPVRL